MGYAYTTLATFIEQFVVSLLQDCFSNRTDFIYLKECSIIILWLFLIYEHFSLFDETIIIDGILQVKGCERITGENNLQHMKFPLVLLHLRVLLHLCELGVVLLILRQLRRIVITPSSLNKHKNKCPSQKSHFKLCVSQISLFSTNFYFVNIEWRSKNYFLQKAKCKKWVWNAPHSR